jgi:hypothetical protein
MCASSGVPRPDARPRDPNVHTSPSPTQVTTGTPGTCTCEQPQCKGGGATGEKLPNGASKSFSAAATCDYYAVGGGIVAQDGRTCHTWRADYSTCGVYDGHTDGDCARISGATCHVSGTTTTLTAAIDTTCDTLPCVSWNRIRAAYG